MNDSEFNTLADEALKQIEAGLEQSDADLDFAMVSAGVLEIELPDGSKIIVNRHTSAREIWLAAKSGGFHFRPAEGRWLGTRDEEDFYVVLSRCMSEQAGEPVSLKG